MTTIPTTTDWTEILDQIEACKLSPASLTADCLYRAYVIGYRAAEQPLLTALANAQFAADLYYERWLNPGRKLSRVRSRRIDEAMLALDRAGILITGEQQFITTLEAAMPPRRFAA